MVKLTTGEKIARDLCEMDATIGNAIEVDPVDVARRIDEAMLELSQHLAAEQLNNKLLRDALEFLNARIVTMDLGGVVERALSLPASTEALDKYVAEKVKGVQLQDIEQYLLQMAGISTAAIGYWKEDDSIPPVYDTPALRDVAKLYANYESSTRQRDLAVEALEKIAAPVRGDGTYNRCREACEILARETLSAIKESEGK